MDNFNVQPVMDGYSAETNMEIDQFFGPNIFKNDKKPNYDTQELYDIVDKIDADVSEVEDTLDHYDEKYCGKDGTKCFTCKKPDLSELPEGAEFDQCGNEEDTDNIIPINETCKLKCKDGYEEQSLHNITGVCSHQSPEPRTPLSYLSEVFIGQYEATFQPSPSIVCNKTCQPLTNEKLKGKRLYWARVEPNCDVTGYSSSPSPTTCNVSCITRTIGSPPKYECTRSGEWLAVDTIGNLVEDIKCENPCSLPSPIESKYGETVDFSGYHPNFANYSGGESSLQCNDNYYPYNGDPQGKSYTLDCTDYNITPSPPEEQGFYWNYPPKLPGLPENIIQSVYDGEDFYLCKPKCSSNLSNPYDNDYYSPNEIEFNCPENDDRLPSKDCNFEISSPYNNQYYFRRNDQNINTNIYNHLTCSGNPSSLNSNWSSPQDMYNSVYKVCSLDPIQVKDLDISGSKKITNSTGDEDVEVDNFHLVWGNECESNPDNSLGEGEIPSPDFNQVCYFTLDEVDSNDYYFHYDNEAHTKIPLVCNSSPSMNLTDKDWILDKDVKLYKYCHESSPPPGIEKKEDKTIIGQSDEQIPPGKIVEGTQYSYDCKNEVGNYTKNKNNVRPLGPLPAYDHTVDVNYTCNSDGSFKTTNGEDINWSTQFQCQPYCSINSNKNWWQSPIPATDINDGACGNFSFNEGSCKLSCDEGKIPTHLADVPTENKDNYITQKCTLNGPNEDDKTQINNYTLDQTYQDKWNAPPKVCEYPIWKNKYTDFYIYFGGFILAVIILVSFQVYRKRPDRFPDPGAFLEARGVDMIDMITAVGSAQQRFDKNLKIFSGVGLGVIIAVVIGSLMIINLYYKPHNVERDLDRPEDWGDWRDASKIVIVGNAILLLLILIYVIKDKFRGGAGGAGGAGQRFTQGVARRIRGLPGIEFRMGQVAHWTERVGITNYFGWPRGDPRNGVKVIVILLLIPLIIWGIYELITWIHTDSGGQPQPDPTPDPTRSTCENNPRICGNHGNCSPSPSSPYYHCECKPGWTGDKCEELRPVYPVPPSPQPAPGNTIYQMERRFPKQNLKIDKNGKLCIQVLNDTDDKNIITVWLDDVPFCDKWIQEDEEGNSIDHSQIKRGTFEKDNSYEENCGVKEGGNVWETYVTKMEKIHGKGSDKVVRFLIINEDGSIYWDSNKRKDNGYSDKFKGHADLEIIPDPTQINRYFKLKSGQVLRIIPPHKYQNLWHYEHCGNHENDPNGDAGGNECGNMGYCPYMCALQKDPSDSNSGNRGFSYGEHAPKAGGIAKNCPGGGIYITDNIDVNKSGNITTDSISRVEYNINNGEIYFNFSAVDGSNMNYEAHYDLRDIGGNLQGDKDNPILCEGKGSIKCNTKHLEDFKGLDPINTYNFLNYDNQFRNLSPYVKSIPSIKFFDSDSHGNLYPGLVSGGNKCVSPIDWKEGSNWVKAIKAIKIFNDNLNEDTQNDQLYKWDGTRDWSDWNRKFNPEGLNPEQREITDKNCAEASSGNGFNKAIYHIWWGFRNNKCAYDYTKIIRNSNNGVIGCSQYTWAYGEMGYDSQGEYQGISGQLESYLSKQSPVLYFSSDGNPQHGPLCEVSDTRVACNGKQKNNIPKDNNLESANKPLLHCRLPNNFERDIKDLKNNPVNINIKIKYVTRGEYDINKNVRRKEVCDAGGRGCDDDSKKCIQPKAGRPPGPECTGVGMEDCFKNMFAPDDKGIPKDFTWCGPI